MNTPFLSQETAAPLPQPGAETKIHIIGVCGVAMGALAISLAERGYSVSGSDNEFYPPMSELLEQSSVKIFDSYDESNITEDLSLVVIGNSVPVSHVEVQAVERFRLPHTFFAKIAGELIVEDKVGIVVSGTHGKTTTSSLVAFGFEQLGQDPSYFIGGQVPQLQPSFKLGEGKVGVIEGDEYDSVFYVKRPKFLFYPPKVLIMNALEFDHADIYESIEQIEHEFELLIERVPEDGFIIACSDYPRIRSLLEKAPSAKVITFGRTEEADYQIKETSYSSEFQRIQLHSEKEEITLKTRLIGEMNALNVVASALAAKSAGVRFEAWNEAILPFTGVARRLQKRFESDGFLLLEDFAHHPTAVKEVVSALKAKYPESEHWAAFEPRSNTSRRAVFQQEYGEAFAGLDRLFLRGIATRHSDTGQQLMDLEKLHSDISSHGTQCTLGADGDEIVQHMQAILEKRDSEQPLVITVMSNGSFDGLIGKVGDLLDAS